MAKEPVEKAKVDAEELQKPKSKLNLKMVLMVVILLAIEGGVFFAVGIGSDPDKTEASQAEIEATKDAQEPTTVGILIADKMSIDSYTGGSAKMMIRLDVAASVVKEKQLEFTEKVAAHSAELKDTIRIVISSAQPDELKDAQKQVVKRSLLVEIEKIVGPDYIEAILFPEWSLIEMD
ncbi:MAG: flagellar basal body-associated FliL family protein [Phycisphaerae bacterium]|nr:flagellar basal body-associated FliL family protein [Phycisphaerae bacterium]